MIAFLNRYFDCQVPAILAAGGEVLKFMGDGLLAIFPIDRERSAGEVCTAALTAARAAGAAIAKLVPVDGAADAVRFGLALHIGDLLYGNIGGGNRLDFTAIGPAVNLAARLEELAAELGRTMIASGEFARHCPTPLVPLGDFPLRGFAAPQPAFALADPG
jgi:adenylate cyclase